MLPLNRWHHLAFVVGKHLGLNRVGYTLFINGKRPGGFATVRPLGNTHLPLYIGGTDISPPGYKEIRWDRFTGGLIDEVRVSNIARYSVEDGLYFSPHVVDFHRMTTRSRFGILMVGVRNGSRMLQETTYLD